MRIWQSAALREEERLQDFMHSNTFIYHSLHVVAPRCHIDDYKVNQYISVTIQEITLTFFCTSVGDTVFHT